MKSLGEALPEEIWKLLGARSAPAGIRGATQKISQKPPKMSDLLQAISEALDSPEVKELCEIDGMEATGVYLCKLLREALEILKRDRWVPVTERLPPSLHKHFREYLCTGITRGSDCSWVGTFRFNDEYGYFIDEDGEREDRIIAWRPLPAPFGEES